MQDHTLLIIILGVVAVALVIQAVALAGAFLAVRRLEARFDKAETELRALQPRIERLGHVIDNLSRWTDSASEHLPRLAKDVETRVHQLRNAARIGAMALVKPLRPFAAALALWKGLKRGAQRYRSFHPPRATSSPWVSAYLKDSAR